jgi:protein-S-isoprenylcysteine O-methyltransferase Ste14
MTKAKLYDLAAGLPQVLLNGATIAGILIAWSLQPDDAGRHGIGLVLAALSSLTRSLFLSLLIFLLFSRRTPTNLAHGAWPKFWALIGLGFAALIAILPQTAPAPWIRMTSLALTLVGTVGSIYVVLYLGRSFSIFPQARGLVMGGPYKHLRHPLYLAEWITVVGMSLQFAQPWAWLLAIASLFVQLPRMRYEETVLLETYPQYRPYCDATARLIPGIY